MLISPLEDQARISSARGPRCKRGYTRIKIAAMSILAQTLANAAWAAVLTHEQQGRVARDTFSREVPEGGNVCHRGDAAQCWNGVVTGLLKISTVSAGGKLNTF